MAERGALIRLIIKGHGCDSDRRGQKMSAAVGVPLLFHIMQQPILIRTLESVMKYMKYKKILDEHVF